MWMKTCSWAKVTKIVVSVLIALCVIGSFSSSGSSNSKQASSGSSEKSAATESSTENQTSQAALSSITAKYTGKTVEGTAISETTSGLTVTGSYSDGSTKSVTDFKVANPSALVAGQTTTYTITAKDKSCTLAITCTTQTPEAYMASCQAVDYESIARNPDTWKGQNITVTGKVVQVQESSSGNTYRVSIGQTAYGNWDSSSTIMAQTTSSYKGGRILEDDIVTLYGTSAGLYTYKTVLGASQTVPLMSAEYIVVN